MLKIRESQIELIVRERREALNRRLEAHLRRFFPDRCAALGDDGLGEFVALGSERALSHGFDEGRLTCKFLNLMCVFGTDFDRDDSLPWVQAALARKGSAGLRMDLLYREALTHVDRLPAEGGQPE